MSTLSTIGKFVFEMRNLRGDATNAAVVAGHEPCLRQAVALMANTIEDETSFTVRNCLRSLFTE